MPGSVNLTHSCGRTGPRGKPTTSILLNRHSIKLPSRVICLYSQISATLTPHRRSFFVQWAAVSGKMHGWGSTGDQRLRAQS